MKPSQVKRPSVSQFVLLHYSLLPFFELIDGTWRTRQPSGRTGLVLSCLEHNFDFAAMLCPLTACQKFWD